MRNSYAVSGTLDFTTQKPASDDSPDGTTGGGNRLEIVCKGVTPAPSLLGNGIPVIGASAP